MNHFRNDLFYAHGGGNQACFVSGLQTGGDLGTDGKDLVHRQRTAFQTVGQGLALHQLHNKEAGTVFIADVVEGSDVGMVQ